MQAAGHGLEFSRVPRIVGFFLAETYREHAHGALRWGILWFAVLAAGVTCSIHREARALPYVAGFLGHMMVYVLVFVATPSDLEWHLAATAHRLLLHTLPWLVFVLALGLRSAATRPRPV